MDAVTVSDTGSAVADALPLPGPFFAQGVRAQLPLGSLWPADDLLADGQGAVGYLLKDRVTDVTGFLDAVRQVAAGGTVLDPEVIAQLLVRRRDPLTKLTAREREVVELMAQGRSNAAIAGRLVVSEGAVEKHVRNIFTKLDLWPSEADHRRVLAVLAYLRS